MISSLNATDVEFNFAFDAASMRNDCFSVDAGHTCCDLDKPWQGRRLLGVKRFLTLVEQLFKHLLVVSLVAEQSDDDRTAFLFGSSAMRMKHWHWLGMINMRDSLMERCSERGKDGGRMILLVLRLQNQ